MSGITEQGRKTVLGALPLALRDKLDRYRSAALESGIPSEDVERWLGLVRRRVILTTEGKGPPAGRLGAPIMLPPGLHVPAVDGEVREHLIATIDFAALPADATNLPLPPDGHLLLFAYPDLDGCDGSAVYIPAGTTVQERKVEYDYDPADLLADMDFDTELQGELRLQEDVSLPDHEFFDTKEIALDLAAHPHAKELREVWSQAPGEGHPRCLRIGGYALDREGYGDPVFDCASKETGIPSVEQFMSEDWVLLAEWYPSGLEHLWSAIVYWAIRKQDLEERRFDRVSVLMNANP
ncbi:DUF1963 domain-containing protein [Actinomadura graeca]|uniref:DUF1963 domain-containing protein n=1 Tax=Actinomadura graeca TaxID=2750812 RepID=A0ABX8QTA7_9ACTN|nr:DUF1963 domain-containing protein [Actinomadura graeca]QXJ21960.1 DUF1963 domain-containing protein [Actinomadura graeca]